MWRYTAIFFCILYLTDGARAEVRGEVVSGKVDRVKDYSCKFKCPLPNYLANVCNPIKQFLQCSKNVETMFQKYRTMTNNDVTACCCQWKEVFSRPRAIKPFSKKMIEFHPVNQSRIIRARPAKLTRICKDYTHLLCKDIRLKEGEAVNTSSTTTTQAPANAGGWEPIKVIDSNKESSTKHKPKQEWQKVTGLPPTRKPYETTNMLGLRKDEEVTLWLCVAGGILVFVICLFFVMKLKRDNSVPYEYGKGSLDTGAAHNKNMACCNDFIERLRQGSKKKAEEREKLLTEEDSSPRKNTAVTRKSVRIQKSPSPQEDVDNEMCKSTQCGTIDFDVSLTSFSVSAEDVQAKSKTGMPLAESESDGEEAKLFHSRLMYGKDTKQQK